jgi:hypothetical protein
MSNPSRFEGVLQEKKVWFRSSSTCKIQNLSVIS